MIRPLNEEVRSYLRSGIAITNLTQCVEELVLNSLDAGASCVTVRVDVPNFKVQVADNGKGITFENLKVIGERYASSKCHFLEDLEQLTFYGYRGEAIASIRRICGVLEIVSRHRSCYKTYCKFFRDSKASEVAESTSPRTCSGTTVTLHDIFSCLPVRRKVVSETLDFERIRQRTAAIALIHPKTAFLVVNESTGTKCLQTHVCKSVVSTFSQLFGNTRSKHLQEVAFEHDKFKVSGFISTATHHSKSLQFLFVNNRLLLKTRIHKVVNSLLGNSELFKRPPVAESKESPGLVAAKSASSPQNLKLADKHGIFVLNLSSPVREYDICLEPAKTLIEFQDWENVLFCIKKCIENFLEKYDLISKIEVSEKTVSVFEQDVNLSCPDVDFHEFRREIDTSNVQKSLHSSTVSRRNAVLEGDAINPRYGNNQGQHKSVPPTGNHTGNHSEDTASERISDVATTRSEDSNSLYANSVNNSRGECLKRCSTLLFGTQARVGKQVQPEPSGEQAALFHEPPVSDVGTVLAQKGVDHMQSTETCNPVHESNHSSSDASKKSPHFVVVQTDSSRDSVNYRGCTRGSNGFCLKEHWSGGIQSTVAQNDKQATRQKLSISAGMRTSDSASVSNTSVPSLLHKRQCASSSAEVLSSRTCRRADSAKIQCLRNFTSPCPITLQRMFTRKRPPSIKGRCVTDEEQEPKARKLITLHSLKNSRRVAGNKQSLLGNSLSSDKQRCCDVQGVHKVYSANSPSQHLKYVSCTQPSTLHYSINSLYSEECGRALNGTDARQDSMLSCDKSFLVSATSQFNNSLDVLEGTVESTFSPPNTNCARNSGFGGHQLQLASHLEYKLPSPASKKTERGVGQVTRSATAVVSNFSCHFEEGNIKSGFTGLENSSPNCVTRPAEDCLESGQCGSGNVHQGKDAVGACSRNSGLPCESGINAADTSHAPSNGSCFNNEWSVTFDTPNKRKLYINRRTGHSFFQPPSEFEDSYRLHVGTKKGESTDKEKECAMHMPHPFAPHLSFACTPWLPWEERRVKIEDFLEKNEDKPGNEDEKEEKLCKWTGAKAMLSYEQNISQSGSDGNYMSKLFNCWQNPVFAPPEKDILEAKRPTHDRNQLLVHNVIHPYRFTRDMLSSMKIVNQLDDKFIVGLVPGSDTNRGVSGLLVLVDQHAAHERVRLERLQSDLFEDGCDRGETKLPIKSSPVSPPLEFSMFYDEVHLLTKYRTEVERIGIRFIVGQSSEFSGETAVVVNSLPSVFVERELSEVKRGRPSVAVGIVKEMITEHLEHVSRTRGVASAIPKVMSRVISSQACHGAVKFGEPLGISECKELIRCLSMCQLPFQCAHGRPSVIPLVDLGLLGPKEPSEEIVLQPKLTKLKGRATPNGDNDATSQRSSSS